MVTSRSSGSSYLNRVELQNGCLAKAHSNLFIPSTLKGSCFNSDTGALDNEKLRKNLEAATDVYINHCNESPCGDTVIRLLRGADSSKLQELRPLLNTFLKGKQDEVKALKKKNPDGYSFFQSVSSVHNNHIMTSVPERYVFYLRCCFKSSCIHPLCTQHDHVPANYPTTWFPDGPSVTFMPFPVPDPLKVWGTIECSECVCRCFVSWPLLKT